MANNEHETNRIAANRKRDSSVSTSAQRQESSVQAPVQSMESMSADLPASCDVLVVGGGINGAGIARDLAGRGLRVVLCEKGRIAG